MGFFAAYSYGAGEALWNREGHVVVETKEQKRALTPEEIQALKKVPTAPPAAPPLRSSRAFR